MTEKFKPCNVKTSKIKLTRVLHCWLWLLCLVVAIPLHAQDQIPQQAVQGEQQADSIEGKKVEEKKPQQDAKQENNEDKDQQQAPTPPVASSGSDSFVPSEEISEDLSVSFPVDI